MGIWIEISFLELASSNLLMFWSFRAEMLEPNVEDMRAPNNIFNIIIFMFSYYKYLSIFILRLPRCTLVRNRSKSFVLLHNEFSDSATAPLPSTVEY